MKLYLTTFLLLSTSLIFSQKLTWGPVFNRSQIEAISGIIGFVGEMNNKIYAISGNTSIKFLGMGNTAGGVEQLGVKEFYTSKDFEGVHVYLNVFDAESKEFISHNRIKITSEITRKNVSTLFSFSIINNKLYFICSVYDKVGKVYRIKRFELNEKGEAIDEIILLEYPKIAQKKGSEEPYTDELHCIYSPDSSKVLIAHSYYNKKTGMLEAQVSTFTSDFEQLSSKIFIQQKYNSGVHNRLNSNIFAISNLGEWTYFCRYWSNRVTEESYSIRQCLSFATYDIKGQELSNSVKTFGKNKFFIPSEILTTNGAIDSFKLVGEIYDGTYKKISLNDEKDGRLSEEKPSGFFTILLGANNSNFIDVRITYYKDIIPEMTRLGVELIDVVNFDEGVLFYVEERSYIYMLNRRIYLVYKDESGAIRLLKDFYSIGSKPEVQYFKSFSDNNDYSWDKTALSPLLKSDTVSDQLNMYCYDVLNDNTNSAIRVDVGSSKVGFVKLTLDKKGVLTRTVLDESDNEYHIFEGISCTLNDGSIVALALSADKGRLVTIRP